MKQEDFWIEDVEFFSDMMAKITDLSRNLYLLVTDLQKNQTFVPEKTAEFLGMEAGYSLNFYQKLTAHVHPYDIPEYEEAMGKRLKKEALSEPLYIRMGKEKTDYMMGFSVDVLRKENREYLIVVLKNENALQRLMRRRIYIVRSSLKNISKIILRPDGKWQSLKSNLTI